MLRLLVFVCFAVAESASDECAVKYQEARNLASEGRQADALAALESAVKLKVGFDLARDPALAALREDPRFQRLVETARRDTPPVGRSRVAFRVMEGDLVPENLAYDPAGARFYFGSLTKHKIVRCDAKAACAPFAEGLGVVAGMKVDPAAHTLWATNNAGEGSSLVNYDLASGKAIGRAALTGGPHFLNDLVIGSKGDVYVTDTHGGGAYVLRRGTGELRLLGRFPSANGIAMSGDERKLYVATFGDGIRVLDPEAGTARPIRHPGNLCLANIDGLYWYRDSLIAIQNGVMTPRVVRAFLDESGERIVRFEVLERRNPLFDGVTTGVLVGSDFYFMANIQDDKPATATFEPITILKIRIEKPH